MKLSLVGAILAGALLLLPIASAQTSGPPAPTNLEIIASTQDSITLAWGPAQPGEFYFVAADKNSVVVGWGPSQDSRSPISYTLSKNGSIVVSGLTTTSYRVTGIVHKVQSFRTCVQAFNTAGQSSPAMCATWARQ